jgi:hypothetical protein
MSTDDIGDGADDDGDGSCAASMSDKRRHCTPAIRERPTSIGHCKTVPKRQASRNEIN